MKTVIYILASLLFPIGWGALVNFLFTRYQKRTHRNQRSTHRIEYHI